jgi:hypothetical protein
MNRMRKYVAPLGFALVGALLLWLGLHLYADHTDLHYTAKVIRDTIAFQAREAAKAKEDAARLKLQQQSPAPAASTVPAK